LCLVLVVFLGSYVRFKDLGQADFHEDELDLYYSALSLERGDPPLLPSGNEYERAFDYSRIVQLALPLSGRPETAARLPAALFGVLSLLAVAGFAWVVGGPWAAVAAALMLAIYPDAVIESRRVRFYSYQLALLSLALWTGWYAIRPLGTGSPLLARTTVRRWVAAGTTFLLFALATRVQVTSISVAAGWFSFALAAAVVDLRDRGRLAWKFSVPLQLLAASGVGGVALLVVSPGFVADLWASSRQVPSWAGGVPGDVRTYYWYLAENYRVVVSLGVVIAIAALVRFRMLALYALAWFAVPFLLHSFVFAWKGPRFILGAVPGLFLLTALVVPMAGSLLKKGSESLGQQILGKDKAPRWFAPTLVAISALSVIATTPAFNTARKIPPWYTQQGWSSARAIFDSLEFTPPLVVGTGRPFETVHYFPRADFTVDRIFLEAGTEKTIEIAGAPVPILHDWYAGLPILPTPQEFLARFPDAQSIVFLVPVESLANGGLDPELVTLLETDAEELCEGRCLDLRMYLWHPGEGVP